MAAKKVAVLIGVAALVVSGWGCASKGKTVELQLTAQTVERNPEISRVAFDQGGRVDTREAAVQRSVTVDGDPGLEGTFSVSGLFQNRPLNESSPGHYTGTFEIPQGSSGEYSVSAKLMHPPTGFSVTSSGSSGLVAWVSPDPTPPPPMIDPTDGVCSADEQRALAAELQGVSVYFATNSSNFSNAAKRVLDESAPLLNRFPECKVYVLGHADPTGKGNYNLNLSAMRVNAVARYLEEKGVAQNRLQLNWYGDAHPVAEGEEEEKLAADRRVELRSTDPYQQGEK
jgi:outer membrane protein OmpA-like peptidoglycan-associated protein